MKMGADFCRVFWIFAVCICMAVTHTIPDDELLLTDDTEATIDNSDWMEEANADDNLRLAARKRFHGTFRKPLSMDKPTFEDVHALVEALDTDTDKLDARNFSPDKRAHMNDAFQTITELLNANADTLDTLTGDVNMIKSELMTKLDEFKPMSELLKANADMIDALNGDVKLMKSELNMISDIQKTNADRQDTLNGDVDMMGSEIMTKLDELKPMSEVQKMNADTLDTLTRNVQMLTRNVEVMKSEIMTKLDELKPMPEMQKANADKLDNLTKYVERLGLYSSCLEYLKAGYTTSGQYWITIPNTKQKVNVYCDQDTDGGGWLVFQRRQDGSVHFYRDWEDYKAGFGEVTGEFWLGNDRLYSLTRAQQELRVDLMDFEGKAAYARYSTFTVGSESEKYALTVTGYSGTAGDSLEYHNGMSFSTKDRDNDKWSGGSCAQTYKGGWWYRHCIDAHLNGLYYDWTSKTCVTWKHWKNKFVCLKKSEMKIRPRQ